ncbi:response regulator transcription factor [Nonomuraea sp. KC401]|uniref:response regulator transcription factor n=1 Tax=unclassified Nonomuraea TaxID=2593643 RepID=UPI0010FD85F1|nr:MULTISPECIES: response regulator transcription factor [unclassified Nonomuraea]NBE93876.1 response regulator [Nonomuraea sp. K271]TLF68488.1 response regulator transcription factor [Nonomuraea sp. KC401]
MRVVLAEDSGLLRESLVNLITYFDHQVVATAATAGELRTAATVFRPDIVVTDVRMPPDHTDDGLRAAIALRRDRPSLPVLVLSQYVDSAALSELLRSGDAGTGYLLKDRVADGAQFVATMREVGGGATVIDPDVVRRLLTRRDDPLLRLSTRELEVLALMAEGRSNAAIGRELVISEVTVSKHIGNIFTKLDLPADEISHRRVLAVLSYLRG